MSEPTENTALHGAAEPDSVNVKHETSLTEAFEVALEISQVDLPECAASKETGSRKTPEQEDRQQGRERDRELDGETVSPPAAESITGSKWVVGAQCRAVWSEDGQVYPTTVASLDRERCRVHFKGYGNEEDVELSALQRPDAALQTQSQNVQDWKPGSRCRAVYSEDGLVYPAVVLWVKGHRCRVRFDNYNNEEEQDVSRLLNPNELHGPSRAAAAKGSSWRSGGTSTTSDCKRSRGEQNSSWVKEKPSKVEKEEKKRGNQQGGGAHKPTNHSCSFFPPFAPPPPQSGSGGPVSFIPPPPPLWTFGVKESSSSPAADTTSSMLMLWYMCGFHTGSYMAQQEFRSKD